MIFLLELLGPAKQPMAGPSSSNRKIMDWEQQQILLTTTNCLILAVVYKYIDSTKLRAWLINKVDSIWSVKLYTVLTTYTDDFNIKKSWILEGVRFEILASSKFMLVVCFNVNDQIQIWFFGTTKSILS